MAKAKELKRLFGVTGAPLQVGAGVEVYERPMNFDEQFAGKIVTKSWVVVDRANGRFYRANTYNGGVGERVDITASHNSGEITDSLEKDVLKIGKTKGYTRVADPATCPFIAIPAPAEQQDDQA